MDPFISFNESGLGSSVHKSSIKKSNTSNLSQETNIKPYPETPKRPKRPKRPVQLKRKFKDVDKSTTKSDIKSKVEQKSSDVKRNIKTATRRKHKNFDSNSSLSSVKISKKSNPITTQKPTVKLKMSLRRLFIINQLEKNGSIITPAKISEKESTFGYLKTELNSEEIETLKLEYTQLHEKHYSKKLLIIHNLIFVFPKNLGFSYNSTKIETTIKPTVILEENHEPRVKRVCRSMRYVKSKIEEVMSK